MLWTLLSVVGLLYVVFWLLYGENECDRLLASVAGPKRIPVFGNILEYIGLSQADIFLKTRHFSALYGDRYLLKVFRRRILNIMNPDDAEVILSSPVNISKSFIYSFLSSWLHEGLLLSDGQKWHTRRRILTPAFHFNILKRLSGVIEDNSRRLVNEIGDCAGERTDVVPLVSKFALHSICETAMGTQLDTDKSNSALQYKTAIMKVGHMFLGRLTKFWQHSNFIYNLTRDGKNYKKLLAIIHAFPEKVIKDRRTNRPEIKVEEDIEDEVYMKKRKRLAMLDLLLDAESRKEIDVDGIKEEVHTFMFEGHDTTAMAITHALMLLANHQDAQDAVYQECSRLSSLGAGGLSELRYLEACVKETLRLYPSVPFISRMISEDVRLKDVIVKAGTTCHIHIFDIHRRADLFKDPEEFRPERFLAENLHNRHPYGYIPFSAGPRNCIGQRFAMMEMKCVLAAILTTYSLEPVTRPQDLVFLADLLLRPKDPVYVRFYKR